jgi:hypothetical protein
VAENDASTDEVVLKYYYLASKIVQLLDYPDLTQLITLKSSLLMALTAANRMSKGCTVCDFNIKDVLDELKTCMAKISLADDTYAINKDPVAIQAMVIEAEIVVKDKRWDLLADIVRVNFIKFRMRKKCAFLSRSMRDFQI